MIAKLTHICKSDIVIRKIQTTHIVTPIMPPNISAYKLSAKNLTYPVNFGFVSNINSSLI